MCLVAWNWQPQSDTPLLLIGNRDEFYARPAQPLHWWPSGRILAGKDLQAGGTWLGVSRSGRLAILTNFRDLNQMLINARSRGELVTRFLQDDMGCEDFLRQLVPTVADYNHFNLLLFDGKRLYGFESRRATPFAIAPGVGAVSNADFETPWPKLRRLKGRFQSLIESNQSDDTSLLDVLQDGTLAPDDQLPDTGIGLDRERALSSPFVGTTNYGTRACSIVRVRRSSVEFVEQCHDFHRVTTRSRFFFSLKESLV